MKITISGPVADGKTTIALLIQEALEKAGFKIQNFDDDVFYGSHYPELQQQRLAAIIQRNPVIEILTVIESRHQSLDPR